MRRVMRPFFVALTTISVTTVGLVLGFNPANAVVGGSYVTKIGPSIAISGCSGTILSRKWAITAWHCADGKKLSDMSGRWGNLEWSRGTRVDAAAVYHQDDIALIRLKPALPAGAAEFATLGNADPRVGATVSFYGWGRTNYDDPATWPTGLKVGRAEVVTPWNNGRGDAYGGPSWTIKNTGGGGVAGGDSGGGAYFKGILVGVTSNADRSGANFASIAGHRDWIRSVTGI